MKYPAVVLLGLFLATALLGLPKTSHAQAVGKCVQPSGACVDGVAIVQCPPPGTYTAGATCAAAPATTQSSTVVTLPNPITCNDATCLIGQVVRYILGSIAVIATLMFIWGGVMMLTSGGNSEQVKRAKETLVWAAIGVVVILLSWVIIKTVLQALTNK